MSAIQLSKLKILVKKEKEMSANYRMPRYSATTKKGIAELTKCMPIRPLADELGVSKSFISSLVRISNKTKKTVKCDSQHNSPLQFLQIPEQINNFMKDDDPKAMPVMRLSIENGITIEIFS